MTFMYTYTAYCRLHLVSKLPLRGVSDSAQGSRSVAICFEDSFCASQKGEVSGWSSSSQQHMAVVLTGFRKTLVDTGWAISLRFGTKWCRNHSPRGSISGTVGSFLASTGQRVLTK